jgi:hypothetical protein
VPPRWGYLFFEAPDWVSVRSENSGYSTGLAAASSEATCCGTSGWEKRFELSIGVLKDQEVGRSALTADGDRIAR